MIHVGRDPEGVRMALEEIFEEDYVRARIDRECQGGNEQTRERLQAQIPERTLSPGYYEFALHLLRLDDERRAGITLDAAQLAGFDVRGLVILGRARSTFEHKHPACSACGARQQNRFGVECSSCGVKFRRKGK